MNSTTVSDAVIAVTDKVLSLNEIRESGKNLYAGVIVFFFVMMCFLFYFEVFVWITYVGTPLGWKYLKNKYLISFVWLLGLTLLALVLSLAGGWIGWFIFHLPAFIFCMIVFTIFLINAVRRKVGAIDEIELQEKGESSDNYDPTAFNVTPNTLSLTQWWFFLVSVIGFTLCLIIVAGVSTMKMDNYYIINREKTLELVEAKPGSNDKLFTFFYTLPRFATLVRFNIIGKTITNWCRGHYTTPFETEEEKRQTLKVDWIDAYNINMTDFNRTDYRDYSSVADFFTRELAVGARPTTQDPKAIASAADCRLVVFNNVPDTLDVWIKGDSYNIKTLLQDDNLAQTFAGGEMAIFRLALQDYHRYHAPVDGTYESRKDINGNYLSVNADAVQSDNQVLQNNKRSVIIFNSNTTNTKVAYVPIGATCVASVVVIPPVGSWVTKGDEFGRFEYGGSTIVMLFPPGTVQWDADLLYSSSKGVETFVKVGTKIGTSIR